MTRREVAKLILAVTIKQQKTLYPPSNQKTLKSKMRELAKDPDLLRQWLKWCGISLETEN